MIEITAETIGRLIMLAEGYFLYRILGCLMKSRESIIIQGIGIIIYGGMASINIYPNDPVNITYVFPMFFLANCFVFRSGWLIRFSSIMLFYPIIIAVNFIQGELFGNIILLFFGEGTVGNNVFYNLSFIFPTAFWLFYWRRLRERLRGICELLDQTSWILLDIICLASMAAIYSGIYFTPRESYKIIPCMIACAVTNMGSIRLASDLADRVRGEMERKNLRMRQDYYEELENSQLQLRRFRHDMKNHFAAAEGLLSEGKTEQAREYFEQLSGHMETRNRRFCKNEIVNAVLNVKYNAALCNDIDCFFHISIDGMTGLDNISLCTVFANTLDNALEACMKIEKTKERRLSVKARYTENGYFSYEITNTKMNEVREKRGRFFTDKENTKSHGLGISSVQEIVDRYNGTMEISYTEKEFSVVILIEVM